jgi:hypothetical protein
MNRRDVLRFVACSVLTVGCERNSSPTTAQTRVAAVEIEQAIAQLKIETKLNGESIADSTQIDLQPNATVRIEGKISGVGGKLGQMESPAMKNRDQLIGGAIGPDGVVVRPTESAQMRRPLWISREGDSRKEVEVLANLVHKSAKTIIATVPLETSRTSDDSLVFEGNLKTGDPTESAELHLVWVERDPSAAGVPPGVGAPLQVVSIRVGSP